MKIAVLTSSRADYGIYLPLLNKIKNDAFFNLEVIAFGTHLSKSHGFTVREIENDNYATIHQISSFLTNDDAQSISSMYAFTALKFADFWAQHQYDLVFCLGDRFEMSAAVQAGIPFGLRFAHIHGGETTLGAIDNIYRHQTTIASALHFTSAEAHAKKVTELKGTNEGVYLVGSLSLENIEEYKPIDKKLFLANFNLTDIDFILVTFHPETISIEKNGEYAQVMKKSLAKIAEQYYILISMPNADTYGSVFREQLLRLKEEMPNRVMCIENFGKENYFSAMHYARIIIGNSSSGIIEAASFGKFVLNIGDRQKGRTKSLNVIDVEFDAEKIIDTTNVLLQKGNYYGRNVYYVENPSKKIVEIIKSCV
jgi:GDP/UDP-N,N'-diacetylbacillosamine 2-epimerase (hydrolysing)